MFTIDDADDEPCDYGPYALGFSHGFNGKPKAPRESFDPMQCHEYRFGYDHGVNVAKPKPPSRD